jgi:polar amino acid transport system substrate-binding protein
MSVRFRATAALILPVILTGCGNTCGCASTAPPHAVIATVAPGDVIVPGTLTICSDLRRPPLEWIQSAGDPPGGADISIGSDIAARLGLKVEIKNTDKAAIPASLSSGGCDIALSGLEIGAPQTQGLVMAPYGGLRQVLLVPYANPAKIAGLADLCGGSVGAIAGSDEEAAALGSGSQAGQGVFAACSSAGRLSPTVRSYATESDAADALMSGQADALFVDSATGAYEIEWHKDHVTEIPNVTDRLVELGVAMRQGKDGLRVAVMRALDAMNADGALATWLSMDGLVSILTPTASGTP